MFIKKEEDEEEKYKCMHQTYLYPFDKSSHIDYIIQIYTKLYQYQINKRILWQKLKEYDTKLQSALNTSRTSLPTSLNSYIVTDDYYYIFKGHQKIRLEIEHYEVMIQYLLERFMIKYPCTWLLHKKKWMQIYCNVINNDYI